MRTIVQSDGRTGWTRRRIVVGFLLLVAFLLVVAVSVFGHFLLELVLPDQTVFAEGFSEEQFARVEVGMSEDEVVELLGPPLVVVTKANGETREYSWPPPDSPGFSRQFWNYSKSGRFFDSYKVRSVRFDKARRVDEVESTYHGD